MSFRSLVASEDFDEEKCTIEPDAKRFDEMMRSVEWVLIREPGHFPEVPGTNGLHMLKTDEFPSAPAVRIWYTYDDQEIFLHSIEIVDGEDGET